MPSMIYEEADYSIRFLPKKETAESDIHKTLTESDLSDDQITVLIAIEDWIDDKKSKLFTLGGYAGTGKSTIIAMLADRRPELRVAFCALTGKAAGVLRHKLKACTDETFHAYVGTIHRMMYNPRQNSRGRICGWTKQEELPYDLIVVDEASMVDERIFNDLQEYKIPILAVGDHGQLPPIYGKFNLMEKPQLKLEKIHRQVEGNPILKLSAYIRKHGCLPTKEVHEENESGSVHFLRGSKLTPIFEPLYEKMSMQSIGALCYTNKTRSLINSIAREVTLKKGDNQSTCIGDYVICLRNYQGLLFNGMRGEIKEIKDDSKHHAIAHILFEEDGLEFEGPIFKKQFFRAKTYGDFDEIRETGLDITSWLDVGMLFDYGYALTVHKAQGSGFPTVVLLPERPFAISDDDYRRWLYTAVTRCSKDLIVVG